MSAVVTSFSGFLLGAIIMVIFILARKKTFKVNNIKPIIYRVIFNSLVEEARGFSYLLKGYNLRIKMIFKR